MSLYDSVRTLPLVVEGYALEGLEQQVSSGFLRKSTVIRLAGAGEEGLGEDVTYEATRARSRRRRRARCTRSPASGRSTRSRDHLATLPLFDHEPEQHAYLDYRRWAYESAALDLALRQAGLSLGDAVGRRAEPLTFVVSMRLGEPATTDRLRAWLELYPTLRFKLDATPDWSSELIAELESTGAVDSVDFKGQYHGTSVDADARSGALPAGRRRASRRLARGSGPDAGDGGRARAAPRARHVGRRDPLGRRHRGASLAAADGEREAVALRIGRAALRRLRLLRGAAASAPTAAASSSSASAATRSSCSPRSSTRARRTTSRPAASTSIPQPGLPSSPLPVVAAATGFATAGR